MIPYQKFWIALLDKLFRFHFSSFSNSINFPALALSWFIFILDAFYAFIIKFILFLLFLSNWQISIHRLAFDYNQLQAQSWKYGWEEYVHKIWPTPLNYYTDSLCLKLICLFIISTMSPYALIFYFAKQLQFQLQLFYPI